MHFKFPQKRQWENVRGVARRYQMTHRSSVLVARRGRVRIEGGAIRISLVTQDRSIIATVTAADSEARQGGYEFMFMVCSEECGSEMKAALEDEAALGNALFQEIDNMEN